jgi:serine/threonine-protein kinase
MNIPKTIGRYEIQQVLGHGAMGIVYLAKDPILQRPIAIKAMRELTHGDDQQNTRERFRREAEISARLNHPNIITVFDVGDDPQVGPYMAMEYVNGKSLAQLIRDGLTLEAGIHLLLQGLGAVSAAAEAGIAHRDIKPENILVSIDGRFKLMDFGIARRGESRLTQAGMVFGTPSYTAPELLVGGEATPATDRYAFAVTAFEVVTGTVPYHGTSIGTTLYKIVHEAPIMPEGMEGGLQRVFQRAFDKKPELRYPDLRSFLAELIQALALPEEVQNRYLAQLEEERGPLDTRVYPPMLVALKQGVRINEDLPSDLGQDARRASGGLRAPGGGGSGPLAHQEAPPPPKSRSVLPLVLALTVVLGGAGVGGFWLWSRPRAIDFTSDPSNAQVRLDGEFLGLTPLDRVPVKRGAKQVLFNLKGYKPMPMAIPLAKDYVRVELEREPFEISVISDPPGAEVLLDGKSVGTTPMPSLKLPWKNTPRLVLRLKGYQEHAVTPERDMWSEDPIRLSPQTKSN